jgi:hypothetical protein
VARSAVCPMWLRFGGYMHEHPNGQRRQNIRTYRAARRPLRARRIARPRPRACMRPPPWPAARSPARQAQRCLSAQAVPRLYPAPRPRRRRAARAGTPRPTRAASRPTTPAGARCRPRATRASRRAPPPARPRIALAPSMARSRGWAGGGGAARGGRPRARCAGGRARRRPSATRARPRGTCTAPTGKRPPRMSWARRGATWEARRARFLFRTWLSPQDSSSKTPFLPDLCSRPLILCCIQIKQLHSQYYTIMYVCFGSIRQSMLEGSPCRQYRREGQY